MAKMAAAMGASSMAATPPAAPHVTSRRTLGRAGRVQPATVEPMAEPICTSGPTRPAAPPNPMVSDAATTLTATIRLRTCPPRVASAVITSGTPCPFASGANRWTSIPTRSPPIAGSSTSRAGPNHSSSAATGPRAKSASSSIASMNPTDPRPVATPTTTARMMR